MITLTSRGTTCFAVSDVVVGRWRIVEKSGWDRDAVDLVEPGFIEFARDRTGRLGFIAVHGWLDCRPAERNGADELDGQ